jgi:HEAT repeat protein
MKDVFRTPFLVAASKPIRQRGIPMNTKLGRQIAAFALLCACGLAFAQPATDDAKIDKAIAQLRDPDHAVRYRAAMELAQRKAARAVEPLLAALNDKDDGVRAEAATALGSQGDGRAAGPLIAMFSNRPEKEWVRENACKSLGDLRAVPAVHELIMGLGNKDIGIQNCSSDALVKIGKAAPEPVVDALITAVGAYNATRRKRAVSTLAELHDPRAVGPIIGVLSDPNEEVRYWAAGALGEFHDARAVEPLVEVAGRAGHIERGPAVEALAKLKDPRAVDLAIAALNDPDGRVGGWAANALREAHDPRAIPALIARIQQPGVGEQPGYARWQAVDTLAALHDVAHPLADVVSAMIVALKDPDARVRSEAVVALGDFGGSRAVEPLIAELNDNNPDGNVPNAAVIALGKLKDRRAVEPLIARLSVQDGISNGVAAAQSLAKIGDPRAVAPLMAAMRAAKDDHQRDGFAAAMGQLGKPALGPLLKLVKDSDPSLRLYSARALGEIKDRRSEQVLNKALKERDLVVVSGASLYFLRHQDEPGVSAALLAVLDQRGDIRFANDLFHNGNEQLKQAAIAWGGKRGYMVLGNGAGGKWLGMLMD